MSTIITTTFCTLSDNPLHIHSAEDAPTFISFMGREYAKDIIRDDKIIYITKDTPWGVDTKAIQIDLTK